MRRGKKQRGRSGGRKVENVRPDRDTEKRVAPSEEEEAGFYLEGDDFRVAERPAAERRHRPL